MSTGNDNTQTGGCALERAVIVHVRVKHSDIRRHTARKMAATDDDDEYE